MTLSHALWTLLFSMVPVAELRYTIPWAILTYDMHWYQALPLAVIGNLLPVPIILWGLDPLVRLLSRVRWMSRIIEWVFARTRRRGRLVERYGAVGLTVFVAIPFPGTGAWTGALLAFLLGIESKRAMVCIALGVLAAGTILTVLTLFAVEVARSLHLIS